MEEKNICPSCNTINEKDSKFCIKCGTNLFELKRKKQSSLNEAPAFNSIEEQKETLASKNVEDKKETATFNSIEDKKEAVAFNSIKDEKKTSISLEENKKEVSAFSKIQEDEIKENSEEKTLKTLDEVAHSNEKNVNETKEAAFNPITSQKIESSVKKKKITDTFLKRKKEEEFKRRFSELGKQAPVVNNTGINDSFAKDLPEWNLTPPEMVVRRKMRRNKK